MASASHKVEVGNGVVDVQCHNDKASLELKTKDYEGATTISFASPQELRRLAKTFNSIADFMEEAA